MILNVVGMRADPARNGDNMKTKEAFVHDNCGEICEAKEFGIHCPTHGELGPDDFTVKDVSSDNATPRPWLDQLHAKMQFLGDGRSEWPACEIRTPIGRLVGMACAENAEEAEANARLIVQAVNAYDELVSSLKVILEGFENGVFVRDVTRDTDSSWAVRLIPFLKA